MTDIASGGGRSAGAPVDIGRLIDDGAWTGPRKMVLFLCALAVVLDGLDSQILGFAIPALIKAWGAARADFAPAVAIGFVGLALGGFIGGPIGDRLGRRFLLIASVFLFGAATAAMALAGGISDIAVCRFISGLGLGAALPAATALIAEYTPSARRSLAVMLGIVCIPVGGFLGGFLAAAVLPQYGWQALFLIGGGLPIVVALLLIVLLPESPRFLLARDGKGPALDRAVGVLGDRTPGAAYVDTHEIQVKRASFRVLFSREFLRDTLGVWAAFFLCLLPVYVFYSWAPTMLAAAGFDLKASSTGLAIFNLGGILGSIAAAGAMARFGSRPVMLALAAGAALSLLGMAFVPLRPEQSGMVMTGLFITGLFLLGLQVALYALAANIYPTAVRATGVGATAGVGRLGAILSGYIGAAVIAQGPTAFFGLGVACLALTFVAVALIQRHATVRRA